MTAKCVLHTSCKAPPEAVYDILSNLPTHLEWNGEQQAKNFRLLSLKSGSGPAVFGTEFESTGNIPFSSRLWRDRSTVTVAQRPDRFEFRTEGTVSYQDGGQMDAVFLHRYEISPTPSGSRVTYTMELESLTNGMWRLAWPVLGFLTWKVGIPMAARPGLRNLARMAEAEAAAQRDASLETSERFLGNR